MGKINVLPQSVAELIAAGEVVDRPASIVKELVENALDAGADRISVEIKNGGVRYLRVSDNGSGISREDIPLAFIRHATSKIKAADDLDSIATLGFRGEALPSVAAVSRVKVTTCTANEPLGSAFYIDGSGKTEQEDCGCAVGTVIEVRDLFYNTPARMKFLKKDITESNAVASLMDRLALANPNVAFELIRDGKKTLKTVGDGNLHTAVRMVCGAEVAAGMVPVDYSRDGLKVKGLISRPSVARTTRSLQTFFINSRYVRSKTCAGAVEEAYKNRMMTGRFPACVINLEIDCSKVDVNVHPAKLEVRFSDERLVYNTIYSACMESLSSLEQKAVPPKKLNIFSLSDFDYSDRQITFKNTPAIAKTDIVSHTGFNSSKPDNSSVLRFCDDTNTFKNAVLSDVKVNGFTEEKAAFQPARTHRKMLDIECDETLDQRLEKPVEKEILNQSVLENEKPSLPVSDEKTIESDASNQKFSDDTKLNETQPAEIVSEDDKLEIIEQVSLAADENTIEKVQPEREEIEPYRIIGELFDTYILIQQSQTFIMIDKHAAHERYIYNSIKHLERSQDKQILLVPQPISLSRDEYFALSEHPEALKTLGITAEDFGDGTILVREVPMLLDGFSLNDLVGDVAKRVLNKKNSITPEVLDELLYSVSCRAAVMAGKRSTMPEMEKLADMVLGESAIRYCPHGRPVLITLSKREVEKMFGRMG